MKKLMIAAAVAMFGVAGLAHTCSHCLRQLALPGSGDTRRRRA